VFQVTRLTGVIEVSGGRRELRKARTRAEVRETAQRLFAERGFDAVTIADVAAAADVAVQTVFNHFESKETLFFDGRTPWVEGVGDAVTRRAPGSDPVTALRDYVQADLAQLLDAESRPENRCYLEALSRSPSLRARERMLVEEAGELTAATLAVAIADGDWPAAPHVDAATARLLSRLIADLFLMAGRVLVLENRRLLLAAAPDETRRLSVQATAAATLTELECAMRQLSTRLPHRAA
jgi:AcrR family transcriptional regulator